jgi:hypothetical protein
VKSAMFVQQGFPISIWVALVLLSPVVSAVLAASPAAAHSADLDLFGCHHDRKQSGYHCHQGQLAGQHFASYEEMLGALEPGRKHAVTEDHQVTPREGPKSETCIEERRTGKVFCGRLLPR